jgi:protein ImuA
MDTMDQATDQPSAARESLADLRRRIAEIEGRPEPAARLDLPEPAARLDLPEPAARLDLKVAARESRRLEGGALSFGIDALDRLFAAGGLPLGTLHEVGVGATREVGALAGFTLALVARLLSLRAGTVLWAVDRMSALEGGHLYAPGLNALGLDPARLILVEASDAKDILWTLEEGLDARGVAAVVGEIRGSPRALDITATRRLALRGRAGKTLALLLRLDAAPTPTAAATRWRLSGRPSGTIGGFGVGVGRPAWRLDLIKNREGRLGGCDLEWDHHERGFVLSAHSRAVSAPPSDRSADPPRTGQIVALDRAS